MKAVRIHAFGGPEVVIYEDIPQPVPKAHEVLLKVTSTCVNYADVQWRLGNYVDRTLPATLGREAAGIIEAVGPGVITLQVGQPIMARSIGGNAEYAIAHTQNVFPCPTGLDMEQAGGIPIIFLTAKVSESDKIMGLELGADDYIAKPFSPRELVARVRAVLRRSAPAATSDGVLQRGALTIDQPRMRVLRNGRMIELTATEFQLLAALARQPGRVFTRAQLLDAVRGTEIDSYERAIDTHVKNIRRKLEPDPHNPAYVLTVYGAGYKFAEP